MQNPLAGVPRNDESFVGSISPRARKAAGAIEEYLREVQFAEQHSAANFTIVGEDCGCVSPNGSVRDLGKMLALLKVGWKCLRLKILSANYDPCVRRLRWSAWLGAE